MYQNLTSSWNESVPHAAIIIQSQESKENDNNTTEYKESNLEGQNVWKKIPKIGIAYSLVMFSPKGP